MWELALLGGIFVALFGLGRVTQVALQLGRIHGLIQRLRGLLRNPFRFF
jgi:Sec-independent protein translocase protein TatA